MTDKPSREDVARVAGEPVAYVHRNASGQIHMMGADCSAFDMSKFVDMALYTESQLLAMYAAGAEEMRERADDAWADAIQSDCEGGVQFLSEMSATCASQAIPLPCKTWGNHPRHTHHDKHGRRAS